jgi:hypothetical protein
VLASKSGYNMQVAVVSLGSLDMYIELACMGRQVGGCNSDQKYTYFLGLGRCRALPDEWFSRI